MTATTVLAYFLIGCYFVIERGLRKGKKALSLQTGASDQGSSRILWLSGLFSILLVLVAPVLNTYRVGYWHSAYVGWIGLTLMLTGLTMRYWAAKALGEFYTRTLQIVEGHRLVDQPPYTLIRHPGYLGTFLMEIGASLAVTNWAMLSLVVVMGMTARIYRIRAEEEMLETTFGERYRVYLEKTWRLVPFIY